MNKSLEQIEAYHQNLLSGAAKDDFEKALESNPDLKEELKLYAESQEAIEHLVAKKFRSDMESWWGEVEKRESPSGFFLKNSRRKWLAAAGFAIVSVAAGWLLLKRNKGNSIDPSTIITPRAIAEKHFSSIQVDYLKGDTDTKDAFDKGKEAFTTGDYTRAASLFNSIPREDIKYAESQLHAGYAHVKEEEWEKAKTAFENVTIADDIQFGKKPDFFSILCMVAADEPLDSILSKVDSLLSEEGHYYYNQTRELKKAIIQSQNSN